MFPAHFYVEFEVSHGHMEINSLFCLVPNNTQPERAFESLPGPPTAVLRSLIIFWKCNSPVHGVPVMAFCRFASLSPACSGHPFLNVTSTITRGDKRVILGRWFSRLVLSSKLPSLSLSLIGGLMGVCLVSNILSDNVCSYSIRSDSRITWGGGSSADTEKTAGLSLWGIRLFKTIFKKKTIV